MTAQLTLGPVQYNWAPEDWRDFYFRIADETPIHTVFLGEVICSKRAPLYDNQLPDVVERLHDAGKEVVFSTLSEVTTDIDRRLVKRVAISEGFPIEANDVSALQQMGQDPHYIGPLMNCYNEEALAVYAENGAKSICLNPEMPKVGIAELAEAAKPYDVALEVQVYGRMSLALSARCYHARAHNRTKDSCLFVCDQDPDGMRLDTLEGDEFLTVNGIQTQSHSILNLVECLDELQEIGINRLRISPQSIGTFTAISAFDDVLRDKISPSEALKKMRDDRVDAPFSNGFFYQRPGYEWHDKMPAE
ncbi:ubiquinone anaerobic biosynthesis protein UbiV [Maritalea myrionectae]|uniref:ubiquinone anaerobic biosynthesis protein UbiV n=1 Tax=Maritalea myrionectae TaxID=454601 RepID=UPI00040DC986|nr:U32 family peptidase [Maritalea myrionectae]